MIPYGCKYGNDSLLDGWSFPRSTHNQLMIRQIQFIGRTLLTMKPALDMSGSGIIIQNMGIFDNR